MMALMIVVFDQALKAWAVEALADGRSVPLVQGLLALRLTNTTGIVVGVFSGLPAGLVFMLTVTALLLLIGMARTDQLFERRAVRDVAVGLVAGGGIGDLVDRARVGAVVDFVDVHIGEWHWPTFSAADAAISIGVLLLALTLRRESRRAAEAPMAGPGR